MWMTLTRNRLKFGDKQGAFPHSWALAADLTTQRSLQTKNKLTKKKQTGGKSQFCKICCHEATIVIRDRKVESEVWWSPHTGCFFWTSFCHKDCRSWSPWHFICIVSTHSPTGPQGMFCFFKHVVSVKNSVVCLTTSQSGEKLLHPPTPPQKCTYKTGSLLLHISLGM